MALKYCINGNNCMKFGCKFYHENKNKKDCIKGEFCYNILCENLHSRRRNYRLFGKDVCYFGINCIFRTFRVINKAGYFISLMKFNLITI